MSRALDKRQRLQMWEVWDQVLTPSERAFQEKYQPVSLAVKHRPVAYVRMFETGAGLCLPLLTTGWKYYLEGSGHLMNPR